MPNIEPAAGRRRVVLAALFASTILASAAAAEERVIAFDLPAEPLADALRDYGKASDRQLIFSPDLVRGLRAQPVRGRLPADEALTRLLGGTDLEWRRAPAGGIMIVRRTDPRPPEPPAAVAAAEPADPLDEVVVTGSHIRGGRPITPILELDRADFEAGGFIDVNQALRSIPFNFGGGLTVEAAVTSTTGDGAENNVRTGVSSPNLRGLGSVATLTLVNGRRLPAAGVGLTVDVSMIPASAIERIEVLPDGASALYGADAVAGVVNIVTRRRFDGVETRLRYGGAEGGLETFTAGVLAGATKGPIAFVAGAEHYDQRELSASKRAATRLTPLPYNVAGDEVRTSVFGSATYDLGPRIQLLADAMYAERLGDFVNTTVTRTVLYQGRKSFQYQVSGGVRAAVAGTWTVEASAGVGENTSKYAFHIIRPAGPSTVSDNHRRHRTTSYEARANGELLALPGGPVRIALGAAHREETLASRTSQAARGRRDVRSVYGELDVPLVGPDNRAPLVEELRLSLAGRLDDYSDFGDVSVPKVAVAWRPTADLQLSGAYSRSFRAPSLFDLTPSYFAQYRNVVDPGSPGGTTRTLILGGTGAPIGPERARNLTFSAVYEPDQIPGLRLTLIYFDVRYRDRIANPDPTSTFFLDLAAAPADFIIRDPSPATVAALAAGSNSVTAIGVPIDPAAVRTILDIRNTNIAASRIEGLQASADYSRALGPGELTLTAELSWLHRFEDRLRPGTPARQRAGTVFSPPRFRSRAGAAWSDATWTLATFWNHTDAYDDPRVATAPRRVRAYDTFDATLSYRLGRKGGGEGSRMILSVVNLLDEGPPPIAPVNTGTLLGYDPTNASIVGRFVSLELVKRW